MELLEIRNNLVKIGYEAGENPVLGKFITIDAQDKSYVAQVINLKSDLSSSFLIARLMFTYTSDGIVDNYDGSVPEISSKSEKLSSKELLDLLPVEAPIKIGNLAQEDVMLSTDISVFEGNFSIFCEHDFEKETFISNCIRQLFRLKEKSVVIDNSNLFEDYPKLVPGKDFKLPLNSNMINFLFDYELTEVDNATKAVIREIFYAVEQYIETLEDKFLPIGSFIEVISSQYKANQMPELALLKNKLLKYKDAGIFADKKEEFEALGKAIDSRNCSIIDLQNINDGLQNKIMEFVHSVLGKFDKYIYLFAPLNDGNSDKALLQKIINNNHVFTVTFASHSYKYASELKEHANNILFFAPQSLQHDFAAYNTFLSKLNYGEAVYYGKLTQGIPFIVEINDLELELTKDDVFGDRKEFVPSEDVEETKAVESQKEVQELPMEEIVLDDLPSMEVLPETDELSVEEIPAEEEVNIPDTEEVSIVTEEETEQQPLIEAADEIQTEEPAVYEDFDNITLEEKIEPAAENIIEPVDNLMADDVLREPEFDTHELSGNDLDFLENNQENMEIDLDEGYSYEDESSQVVPVYSADEEIDDSDIDFEKGDVINHPKYGRGIVEKIIKYGNRTLCSISFENVGRRLLDPSVSEFEKV